MIILTLTWSLGLTWFIGLYLLLDDNIIYQTILNWIFVILNAFQVRNADYLNYGWCVCSGGLRFGGSLCKIFGGPLSYVEYAKIFRPLPCENVVIATCSVCISILTGARV